MLRKSIGHLLQSADQTSARKVTHSTSLMLPPLRSYISGGPILPQKKIQQPDQNLNVGNAVTVPVGEPSPRKVFFHTKKEVETNKLEIENNKSFSNKK